MKVFYQKVVEDYLFDLIEILYQKEYFGFYESAELYVEELIKTIYASIEKLPKKTAPLYFSRYGKDMHYITVKKSKNTQWQVFFNTYQVDDETVYFVRYITNNHVSAHKLD